MSDPMARFDEPRLEQHRDAILRVCRRVLRHPQDAEDACQEVLLELHRQAASVQDPAAFPGWVYRTALHTALDLRRKRGRDRVRDARARAAFVEETPTDELSDSLAAGLDRLDDDSRALLVEHYLAGRSMRELAAERGVSRIAIWKRLRNVRKRLRSTVGAVAMGPLEAARWPFFGPAALPVGMAALVGVALLISLPGSPMSPTSPLVQTQDPPPAPSKPYPYKASTLEGTSAAQWTWSVLSTRKITLDENDITLAQTMEVISRETQLKFIVDPDVAAEHISFKVQTIAVDGCLRLLLQPRRTDYEIRPDGQIHVGRKDKIEGGFERAARAAEAPLWELLLVGRHLDSGWNGVGDPNDRSQPIAAALKRTLTIPQGESSLQNEFTRLAKAGVHVSLDLPTPNTVAELKAREVTLNTPFLQPVEERSVGAHLDQLAARLGLVVSPISGDTMEFTTPEKAAARRARTEEYVPAARAAQQMLDKALPEGGKFTVQRFAAWVQSTQGLPVIPSEDAWNATAEVSIPGGATLRQALDALKAKGWRWALSDGKLYLLK